MTNSKLQVIPEEILIGKIYLLRNQKIMIDRDLAELYGVLSIRLREQVKRNIERFPSSFMFQLTESEVAYMVSQNVIPSIQHLGGALPYAFTEHGVLMLANVLKGDRAIQVSLRIIEIFVKMREMLSTHKDILLQLEKMEKQVGQNNKDIQNIFSVLKHLLEKKIEPRKKMGYKIENDKE
jgi:phage regulator Rha-like protein